MSDRKIGACERNGAVRIDIQEKPLGPMPGFPMSIPRCVVNIYITKAPVDNMELLAMAQQQRGLILGMGKHYCSMAFHFWFDRKKAGKERATAIVDYAPGGKWEDAYLAKIGDYSKHSFMAIHNETGESTQ